MKALNQAKEQILISRNLIFLTSGEQVQISSLKMPCEQMFEKRSSVDAFVNCTKFSHFWPFLAFFMVF